MTTPQANPEFSDIVQLIEAARHKSYQAVNTLLIELYWQVGAYISHKLQTAEWGVGVVAELARHLSEAQPNLTGFTRSNLFRMRQFYETYSGDQKVAPLVRQLSWSQIAQYETQLPDKKLLKAKLHEFYALNSGRLESDAE